MEKRQHKWQQRGDSLLDTMLFLSSSWRICLLDLHYFICFFEGGPDQKELQARSALLR